MNALNFSFRFRRSLVALSLGVTLFSGARAEESPVIATAPQELTRETLFGFLVGELAVHYGDLRLANSAYTELLTRTRDPRVSKRALDIALTTQQWPQALQAAQQWADLEPTSEQAQETYAALLLAGGKTEEAQRTLEAHLKAHPERAAPLFVQLDSWLDRLPATKKMPHLPLAETLTAKFKHLPEAQYAIAGAALNDNNAERGLTAVELALKSKPKWAEAALVKAGLLQIENPVKASEWLQTWQKRNGEHPLTNSYLARLLLTQNKVSEARNVFERQIKLAPRDAYAAYAAGLIAREQNDFKTATTYLRMAQDRGYRDSDAVSYYLADSLAEQGARQNALEIFDSIDGDEWSSKALARSTAIRAKNGQLDAALRQIQKTQTVKDSPELWQLQAEAYRQAGRYPEAVTALNKGLQLFPDESSLLYLRAMVFDRLGQLKEAEQDLRKILQQTPDDATTLNALGYMLADRGDRLEEARGFIEKAHSLKPNDPYILDSLGWVYVRLGKLEEALNHLQKAYAKQTDPEIAAHLVENLWQLGRKDEARKLLQGAHRDHPDHEALKNIKEKIQSP